MEIKTTQSPRETSVPEVNEAPEKSMYLRRKSSQQTRKSYPAGRALIRGARIAGKIILFFLALGFLASVVIYPFTSDRFVLQTVTILGNRHFDTQKLEAIVRGEFPRQIMRIQLKQLRARLEQEVWARQIEIRRVLPSELVIYVEERQPSIILEIDGELALLDEDGVYLDQYALKYGKIDAPVFRGTLGRNADEYRLSQAENSSRIHLGQRMLADLDSGSIPFSNRVSEVDVSDKNNVRIILVDDPAEIWLGDRDFLKRFLALMANMDQYRDLKVRYKEIASIDLRFDNQIVYRPRQAPDVEVPLPGKEPEASAAVPPSATRKIP